MENGKTQQSTGRELAVVDKQQDQALDRTAFEPNTTDGALQLLSQLVPTGLLPKHIKSPQAGLLCLILGREHGLTMLQSLMHLYVVPGGFPQMSTELLVAKVRASGVCAALHPKEMSNEKVVYFGKRKDTGEEMSSTWTIQDARNAGLVGKDNWRHYPKRMLMWRAAADVVKGLFADVVIGLASREEMLDGTVIDVTPGVDTESAASTSTLAPSSPVEALKQIAKAAASVAELEPQIAAQQAEHEAAKAERKENRAQKEQAASATTVSKEPAIPTSPAETKPAAEPPKPPQTNPETEAPSPATSGELTQDEFSEKKKQLADILQKFVAEVGDKKRAKELWEGSVPGVAGVQTLKGVRTSEHFQKRLDQANALLERAKLNTELSRARREILDALGQVEGSKRIRDLAPGAAESAFAMAAMAAHELLDVFLVELEQINKAKAESDDDLFADAREPGSDG